MFRLVVILITVGFSAQAAADRLYLGALSEHPFADPRYEFNEAHRLIAYERHNWVAGYFDNSYDEDTFLAGRKFSAHLGAFEFSAIVGASYGYRDCVKGRDWPVNHRRVCPVAIPAVTYTGLETQLNARPTLMMAGEAVVLTVSVDPARIVDAIKRGL